MNYKQMLKKNCDEHEVEIPFDTGCVYNEQLNFREIIINDDIKDSLIERAVIPILNFNRYDDEHEKVIQGYVREPIKILINTSGGCVEPCMSLVSAIRASKTPVHTYVLGKAYSAGFLILIAGHQRFAQEYSCMMLHPGKGGYVGTFPSIIKHAVYIQDLQDKINKYIADSTDVSLEELENMCASEYDWYMYADEALCRGIIDGIQIGENIYTMEDVRAVQKEKAAKEKEANKTVKPDKKSNKKPTKKTKE